MLQEILLECFLARNDMEGGAKYAIELAKDNDKPIHVDARLGILRMFESIGRGKDGVYIYQ